LVKKQANKQTNKQTKKEQFCHAAIRVSSYTKYF